MSNVRRHFSLTRHLMNLRHLTLVMLAGSVFGCASNPEVALPATPENYARHSKSCRESAQMREQIVFSPKALRTNADNNVSLSRVNDPNAYGRCMRAYGYVESEQQSQVPKAE